MIGGRVADVIIGFSRDRDDKLLANFERVRGLDAEWKLLPRPAKDCFAESHTTLGQPEFRR